MTNSDFLSEVLGDLESDEYGWVCNFRASPEHGEWGGRAYRNTPAQAATIDRALDDNTYFSTACLAGFTDSGKWARQKSTFKRLLVLVLDDTHPEQIIGGYSWAIQTSPGKWQCGILLDRDDPDCSNLELVDAVMSALSARGKLGGNDSSGNAAVRYVRLPVGSNTKPRPAGVWRHQLEAWHPQVRWMLSDACHAVGLDLDALRGQVPRTRAIGSSGEPAMGSVAGEALAMLSASLDQRSYHDSLIRLAGTLVAGGMYPANAVNFLYSVMDQVRPTGPAEEVARWQARRAEIPRAVKSAEKWAPEDRAPASVTISLGGGNKGGENGGIEGGESGVLKPLDWAELEGRDPEPAVFRWAGWLPERTTTLLSANGGVGKSNLALQLAVCLASGQQFLERESMPSRVLVLSAEDEARTVHFRVHNICADAGVSLSALSDRLVVYDLAQIDSVLWRNGSATERMQWLADAVEKHRAQVVIIDNASDVYADNENDRTAVRGFMRCLNMIAAHYHCAMLLLAHVDKASVRMGAGLDTDSTFSGSTAWNNSARSRWAMVRSNDQEIELRHEKCNFGPKQEEIRLEFDAVAKVFRQFGKGPASAAAVVVRNTYRAAILRCIATACDAGQKLSMAATSNNNAFRVLASSPGFPKVERAEFFSMLFEMQRERLLEERDYLNEHRKKHRHIVLTEAGRVRVALGSGAPPRGH